MGIDRAWTATQPQGQATMNDRSMWRIMRAATKGGKGDKGDGDNDEGDG